MDVSPHAPGDVIGESSRMNERKTRALNTEFLSCNDNLLFPQLCVCMKEFRDKI